MFQFTSIISIIFILFFYYAFESLKSCIHIIKKVNEFPGRKGYPLLGNSMEFWGSPDFIFKEIRKSINEYVSIGAFRSWLFFYPVIWLHEPEDMEKILGAAAITEKPILYQSLRAWLGKGLLLSSGQHWHTRRKMLTPTFHFNILRNFISILIRESRQMVEIIEQHLNEEMDITPMIFNFTLDSICETSMGVRLSSTKEADSYRKSVHKFGQIVYERFISSWKLIDFIFFFTRDYWNQKKLVKVLHKFSNDVIAKRKLDFHSNYEDDTDLNSFHGKKRVALLDMLLLAQRQGEDIDDDGIREEVDTFMFAGHDTTSVCLTFTLMLLANNRNCQDKIYEEILTIFGKDDREPNYNDIQELKYMERCIKESLRLYPSVPLIGKQLCEDVQTKNGYIIPKGCTAVACIYDMHRKADLYPEPLKFDPDRFLQENCLDRHPYAYIPFSAGPRNCIGQKFALMEIKCALTEILRRFIIEPVDLTNDVRCMADMVLRPHGPVRVKFMQRS
ncbi:hypothetical protein WA026_018779 [Henosepilachna vigintioctopunctata]|uniref:Cytochrome P450 n=1 Tax=Henosepilachna vigintioctopunctata TaxID=420089 RepID=A0AAW1TXS1_9CUCU